MAFLTLRVALAIAVSLPSVRAAEVAEHQVKSAFLYQFAKFVSWSQNAAAPGDPLVIVVFGNDTLGNALDAMVADKRVQDRPVAIRRVSRIEDLKLCHILFISASERRRAADVLRAMAEAPALTVSELEDFIRSGGMVRLFMEDNRVRFEVNIAAARSRGLRVSSRLLAVAKTVWE